MWIVFTQFILLLVSKGTKVSAEVGEKDPCSRSDSQAPGGVWQEGCLVKTCVSGTVQESLADVCVQLINKQVDKSLEKKGIGCSTHNEAPTEASEYTVPDKLFLGNKNLIDLKNFSLVSDCSLPSFPVNNSQYTVTELVDGYVTVCGGSSRDDINTHLRSCYSLRDGVWVKGAPMLEARVEAAGSMTKEGWLVTGGRLYVTSTEYYRDGEWIQGPELPHSLYSHCQVTVNDTVYVMGGNPRGSSNVYMLKNGKWVDGPRMRHKRRMSACVEFNNSIWAIGGDSVVTVERLDLATMTWHKEPDLWIYPYATNAVVYDSTIYLVHGTGGLILKLNTDNHKWENAGKIESPGYRPVYPAPSVSSAIMGC